jgi:hypothetical protein
MAYISKKFSVSDPDDDDEHHRLALINIPGLGVRDPDAVGTDHVVYSYNNLGELLSTYRRLKAAGILPHRPINHGVTTSMYYRDPDNNRVELQIDNFATPAELDGYFHSTALAENPVGVTCDPEELCRRYESRRGDGRSAPHPAIARRQDPLGTCCPAPDRYREAMALPSYRRPARSRLSANSRAIQRLLLGEIGGPAIGGGHRPRRGRDAPRRAAPAARKDGQGLFLEDRRRLRVDRDNPIGIPRNHLRHSPGQIGRLSDCLPQFAEPPSPCSPTQPPRKHLLFDG